MTTLALSLSFPSSFREALNMTYPCYIAIVSVFSENLNSPLLHGGLPGQNSIARASALPLTLDSPWFVQVPGPSILSACSTTKCLVRRFQSFVKSQAESPRRGQVLIPLRDATLYPSPPGRACASTTRPAYMFAPWTRPASASASRTMDTSCICICISQIPARHARHFQDLQKVFLQPRRLVHPL